MRTLFGLCLCVSLFSAPAFAQEASEALPAGKTAVIQSEGQEGTAFTETLGFLDKLTINRAPERPIGVVAPYETEQLGLAWSPNRKWGITLDLTSRSENKVLPREELSAGAYFQISPRLRFGGGLTLNGDSLRTAADGWKEREGEAGVRIESAFSF